MTGQGGSTTDTTEATTDCYLEVNQVGMEACLPHDLNLLHHLQQDINNSQNDLSAAVPGCKPAGLVLANVRQLGSSTLQPPPCKYGRTSILPSPLLHWP
jgi:hypothetical protein